MAEFVAEEGALKGLVLALNEGEMWTIGRDPDSSDLIVEDPKVSRKHLICHKTPEGFVLENLSLTNPTKVNDQVLIEPILLHDGDKITIGNTVFHFYAHAIQGALHDAIQDAFIPAKEPSEGNEE